MPEQSPLSLKIAIATYGHTAAFKNGEIPVAGVKPDFIEVKPIIAAFRRMVRDLEFDVCEMASATYMIAREAGLPFKALPVFTYRNFHHSGFVCRADAGIHSPKDLEGKRVGVRAYSVTTGIWTRGILQNDYGVDLSRITWVVDDEEHVQSVRPPPNVVQAPAGRSLAEMMAAGELHAAFTANAGIGRAGPPQANWTAQTQRPVDYAELFTDAPRLEAEWFRKTGIYPVHSLIVVKDEVLDRHPWVAKALFDALYQSKEIYLRQLNAGESVSDKDGLYRQMAALVGDPLPYGIAENRPAIEALNNYCHQQGLLKHRSAAEDLFVNCSHSATH
ncbi:MAG: ABC transporter substrate-binding protein [Burkholderiales bacterium]